MELSDATEKSPVTTPGIDPGTLRLVAQCLNHYATPGPSFQSAHVYQRSNFQTVFIFRPRHYVHRQLRLLLMSCEKHNHERAHCVFFIIVRLLLFFSSLCFQTFPMIESIRPTLCPKETSRMEYM
jgi:hypothetical protein